MDTELHKSGEISWPQVAVRELYLGASVKVESKICASIVYKAFIKICANSKAPRDCIMIKGCLNDLGSNLIGHPPRHS